MRDAAGQRFTREKAEAANPANPMNPMNPMNSMNLFSGSGSIRRYVRSSFHPRTAAERSNTWRVTAWAYEPFWRRFSTGILTRGAWNLKKECRLVCEMLEPENGCVYLDVGCSTGVYARAIRMEKPESRIVLVDYSLPMLKKARAYAAKSCNQKTNAGSSCEQKGLDGELSDKANNAGGFCEQMVYVQCDAAEMPFPDGSFDGLVMGGTLNELTEPSRVLCEMARVLKRGSKAVVMHLVKKRPAETLMQKMMKKGGVWFAGTDDIDQMFRDAGFTILDSKMEGAMRLSLLAPESHPFRS